MPNRSLFLDALDHCLRKHPVRTVLFAHDHTHPPLFSYVVNFPRLELPLHGHYEMEIEKEGEPALIAPGVGTALVAPPNCWNRPTWRRPVRLMSFLFGKKQLGISIVTGKGVRELSEGLDPSDGSDRSERLDRAGRSNLLSRSIPSEAGLAAEKLALPRPLTGPGEKILQSILELSGDGARYPAFPALVTCLLHCLRLLIAAAADATAGSRPHRLFEEICFFLQHNYLNPVSRDSVAVQFGVSSNHLSRLFREQGHMGFSEYLTYVRIDRAKFLLLRYPMRLDEIAARCGFSDTAYFCRVFKKITRKTPSEYRDSAAARGI